MARGKAAHAGLDPPVVQRLKVSLERGRDALASLASRLPPTRGLELAYAASDLVDDLVTQLAVEAAALVPGAANAAKASDLVAIIPVGGYGRRELCPRSDLDLLFLVPGSLPRGRAEEVSTFVNAILYGLWDLG